MNDLLREKLTNLMGELESSHKEIMDTFCKYDGYQKADKLLEGYKKEKMILRKYKCDRIGIIEYSVKLDMAIGDLHFILNKHKLQKQ